VYVTNKGSRATIDFHGLNKDIVVHSPPENFILHEHYAEAIQIADRSFNAQNTRASSPGGLTASVSKIEALELHTTGWFIFKYLRSHIGLIINGWSQGKK
jgi:hypothetical protein